MSATIINSTSDVLVYGATPCGIACAVRIAREGFKVLLLSPHDHIGGMISNGVALLDTQYRGRRAPLLEEFWDQVLDHYRSAYGAESEQYENASTYLTFEPHVGERVLSALVEAEPSLTVLTPYHPISVERAERRLYAATFGSFRSDEVRHVECQVFVDASYEGDLFALAGVAYRVGRESRAEYDEPHAGKILIGETEVAREHGTRYPREAQFGRLNLWPYGAVSTEVFSGSTGEGDDAVQAYNYRLTLSRDPENRLPIERPASYDRERYLGILLDDAQTVDTPYPLKSTWLLRDVKEFEFQGWKKVPNGKAIWNYGQLPGGNHEYPAGDWPTRRRIMREHLDHDLGLLYFLQYDVQVPDEVRERARQWGLSKDEYVDNAGIPWEFYVREARKMVGRYVFTEHDASVAPGLKRTPIHADSIAISEWPLDSHECTLDRTLGSYYDGNFLLTEKTRPAQVPYGTLLPKDLDNMLVPGCLSATHVGIGTLRVEPTWMHIGEATGYAAALALRSGVAPGSISCETLQRRLVEAGIMISFFNDFDMRSDELWAGPVQFFGAKGFFDSYDARPHDPLTESLAKEWTRSFAQLVTGTLDPTARAQAVAAVPAVSGGAVSAARLMQLVEFELSYCGVVDTDPGRDAGDGLPTTAAITRGRACSILYQAHCRFAS